MQVQWREEERILGPANPSPTPPRWALATEVERGRGRAGHPNPVARLDGTGDNIPDLAARFKELPGRRLVILGGPGAG
ncbi:hypothetical protein ACQPZP_34485 [Spirillospora sp. CA-142024]|uniref:hypothetical protein n=1 Tax=Spirillospora sp. CA-142024 TaxID=3240036 RepID=UPI003D92270B